MIENFHDVILQEHYCLRLSETVKSLQEQIKQQNKIISQLAKVKIYIDLRITDSP